MRLSRRPRTPSVKEAKGPRLSPIGSIATIVSRWGNGRDHDVDADVTTGVDAEAVAPRTPVELPPVEPVRVTRDAVRAEVVREAQPAPAPGGHVRLSTPVPMKALDDFAAQPVVDPIIGPRIATARQRLNLSIDQLSDRTRIRPHVLEAIEVDDFAPCGGDFYARGHLTTITRVLGIDLAPLMAEYDARYAHAPINARRVFEAELATGMGGGIRATTGGPRWSLLLGAVMALVLVWGVARLFATPAEEFDVNAPVLSDSAGLSANQKPITSEKMAVQTIALNAKGGPSKVVVRDRNGKIVFTGVVEDGASQRIAGLAPFGVEAEHADKIFVSVKGQDLGSVGTADAPMSRNFG